MFGFRVVKCENFFDFVLNDSEKFDALFDNPPWDKWFLALYYRFVRYMAKPSILILPRGATSTEAFLNVFGRCLTRSVISNGTFAEKEFRIQEATKKKAKRARKRRRFSLRALS